MAELPPMIEKIMQMNPVLHVDDLLLRRLLDKLPVGVYTCDARGMITSYNRQAVAIWGRTPQLNHPLELFCGSHELFSAEDGAPVAHEESWMAKALREELGFNERKLVIGRPDGRRTSVLMHANPVHDAAGKLLGAFNVMLDITEHRPAETTLHEAQAAGQDPVSSPQDSRECHWQLPDLQTPR